MRNEKGSAIMQVMFISTLLGIISYFLMDFMSQNDRDSMRMIRRADNLVFGSLLSDQINDAALLQNLSATFEDGTTYP